MAMLPVLARRLTQQVRLRATPSRSYYARSGIIATARLPGRLDNEHLPFYFRASPDDRDKHVDQFPPEEAKERQQWIDKIIAMADSNQEPDLAVYEGVLELVVRYKDAVGAKTMVAFIEEVGMKGKTDPSLLAQAGQLIEESHLKSYW